MTSFVANLLNFIQSNEQNSKLEKSIFLVANMPGQPFTLYDDSTQVGIERIADIYDRLVLKSLESMNLDVNSIEICFVAFGFGALVATRLALGFGQDSTIIKSFFVFNGVFRADDKTKKRFKELAEVLEEAHESVHPKLIDIASNCNIGSFRLARRHR